MVLGEGLHSELDLSEDYSSYIRPISFGKFSHTIFTPRMASRLERATNGVNHHSNMPWYIDIDGFIYDTCFVERWDSHARMSSERRGLSPLPSYYEGRRDHLGRQLLYENGREIGGSGVTVGEQAHRLAALPSGVTNCSGFPFERWYRDAAPPPPRGTRTEQVGGRSNSRRRCLVKYRAGLVSF